MVINGDKNLLDGEELYLKNVYCAHFPLLSFATVWADRHTLII